MLWDGSDLPVICPNFEIKISSLVLSLVDYDVASQQLKIKVYLPHCDTIQHFEDLKTEIEWIVLLVVGEIAYRRHIKAIELSQLPLGPNPFLPLVELVDLIESVSGLIPGGRWGVFNISGDINIPAFISTPLSRK